MDVLLSCPKKMKKIRIGLHVVQFVFVVIAISTFYAFPLELKFPSLENLSDGEAVVKFASRNNNVQSDDSKFTGPGVSDSLIDPQASNDAFVKTFKIEIPHGLRNVDRNEVSFPNMQKASCLLFGDVFTISSTLLLAMTCSLLFMIDGICGRDVNTNTPMPFHIFAFAFLNAILLFVDGVLLLASFSTLNYTTVSAAFSFLGSLAFMVELVLALKLERHLRQAMARDSLEPRFLRAESCSTQQDRYRGGPGHSNYDY